MSNSVENGHSIIKFNELCLSCGLCCRGAIFHRASLDADEISLAKSIGLRYFSFGKKDFAFSLPCHKYSNDKCSVYLNRPGACRRYRCKILRQLINGEVNLEQSRTIVLQARKLLNSIDEETNMEQSGDPMQRIVRFMDLRYKNSIACKNPEKDLLKDIGSFFAILQRYFEERLD